MSREAVSHPGIYVRGATTAITRRTTLRKAFLAPWHELVEQSWLYSLGDAQQHTGVAIHGSNVVIDHHHTEVTAPDGPALVEFTRRVHVDMSKAINTLLSELRYDAPGEVWDDRPPHRMRLVDAAAQISHHVYGQLNSTAAGLVARPDQMPMTALSQRHWKGGPLVIDRPPVMFDPRTRPAQVEVWVSPEPLAFELFDGELDALIHHLDRLCERGWRRIRDARRGRRPMGAKAVRRIHPWNEPRTLRETRGQPVRTFKVGAQGIVGVRHEIQCAQETTVFRADHREVRTARRDGDLERVYPFGTFAAAAYQGAPVATAPAPGAILTAPGPTLEEVKAALAERRGPGGEDADGERAAERRRVIDEVGAAFANEAAEIVAHDDLELCRKVPIGAESSDEAAGANGGVQVRHRFDARPTKRSSAARIVTLRDRRRGRPRRSDKRGDRDPPV